MRIAEKILLIIVSVSLMTYAAGSYAGVWQDDFEDGRADGWDEVRGTWEVIDGIYEQTDIAAEYQNSIHENETWTDYALEIDITILESSGASTSVAAGVLLRANETGSSGYRIWIRTDSGGFQFSLWENDSYTHIVTQAAERAISGETYRLKVEIEGSTLSAWVDDRVMFEDQVDEGNLFPTGRVGLINYNCHVQYDNLTLSGDGVIAVSPTIQSTAIAWGIIKLSRCDHL